MSEEVLSQWSMRGRDEEHLLHLREQSRVSKSWASGRLWFWQLPLAWVPLKRGCWAMWAMLLVWVFFVSWEKKFRGFFREKKNPVIVLITELMSTHIILKHRCPTMIHMNVGLNKEMPFSLKPSIKKPTL